MSAGTALVTGASGFTGRYLVPTLQQRGFQVVGAGLGGQSGADRIVSCDLTDGQAVRALVEKVRPDLVVHLAALAFVGHGDAEAFYKVNVFGTLNLLEALAPWAGHLRKVLVASSANVYGSPGVEVIDESVCPAPLNHYACSKLAMEHMVRTWFERLPIVIARPFNYTGVGQDEKFLIPKIVNHFRRKAPFIELGNLDVARDFSDVRDVVAAYMAILEGDAHSDIFNICSGRSVALREVLQRMVESTGHEIEVRVNRTLVRTNEIPVLRGDPTKLADRVGLLVNHALPETLDWMYRHRPQMGAED